MKREKEDRKGALENERENEMADYRFFLYPSSLCANSDHVGERDQRGRESYTRAGVTQKQPM